MRTEPVSRQEGLELGVGKGGGAAGLQHRPHLTDGHGPNRLHAGSQTEPGEWDATGKTDQGGHGGPLARTGVSHGNFMAFTCWELA